MYTNPSNIIKTLVNLLDTNEQQINRVVRVYQGSRRLTVLEGMRQSLPVSAYPSFEIEPGSTGNRWATTRAQRPRFTFTCTLTVSNNREKYGVEYVSTLATILAQIMTSPENLQMRVLNETKWDINGGLKDTYILDSLVEDVSFGAARDGTMRTAEFSWFVEIHETFPESKWRISSGTDPSVLLPKVVSV